jgi:hypothetical protein
MVVVAATDVPPVAVDPPNTEEPPKVELPPVALEPPKLDAPPTGLTVAVAPPVEVVTVAAVCPP